MSMARSTMPVSPPSPTAPPGPDLVRSMTFGVRCAYAHGVSAIRTHLDTYADSAERTWEALAEVRAAWAGRVDLQAVSLCPIDLI